MASYRWVTFPLKCSNPHCLHAIRIFPQQMKIWIILSWLVVTGILDFLYFVALIFVWDGPIMLLNLFIYLIIHGTMYIIVMSAFQELAILMRTDVDIPRREFNYWLCSHNLIILNKWKHILIMIRIHLHLIDRFRTTCNQTHHRE